MKTLVEFRKTVEILTVHQFEELFSIRVEDICDEGVEEVMTYDKIYYIFVLPNGEYFTEFENQSHINPVLARVEEVLWDDYVKWDKQISFENMEKDLHWRARRLLESTEFEGRSLDEINLKTIHSPYWRQQIPYLMERFDRLSDARSESEKQIAPDKVIEFAKNMTMLMKKLFVLLLSLIMVAGVFTSCKKEEVDPYSDCVKIHFTSDNSNIDYKVKFKRSTGQEACIIVKDGEHVRTLCDVSGPEDMFITDKNDYMYAISYQAYDDDIYYNVSEDKNDNAGYSNTNQVPDFNLTCQ